MKVCGVTISEIVAMPQNLRDLTYDCICRVNGLENGMILKGRMDAGDSLKGEEIMDMERLYTAEQDKLNRFNRLTEKIRNKYMEVI